MAALRAQTEAFEHVITANTTSAPLVRLCERLLAVANGLPPAAWGPTAPAGRAPGHFGKVFLADNGSTAVEIAMKMALQAQAQRGAPAARSSPPSRTATTARRPRRCRSAIWICTALPIGRSASRCIACAACRIRSGPHDPGLAGRQRRLAAIERALDQVADTLAAVVYEPVLQAAGGMRFYSPDLLRRLRALGRRARRVS